MSTQLTIKNCLRIKQNDLYLYIFTIKSELIHNNFNVSRRYLDREEGYQRILTKTKIKKIENYLGDSSGKNFPSILPNSILLTLDNIVDYSENTHELIIDSNDDNYKGLIIDGQHRSEGAYQFNSNFELIVVGISDLEPKYQARLFVTVNQTQKKLPQSLYMDLFDLTSDDEILDLDSENMKIDIKAAEITKELNNNEDYVFYKIIDLTGEKQVGHISLSEFIRHTKPFINYDNGKLKEYSFNEQVKIIHNYFDAIKTVFNSTWEKDNKPIFKTTIFGGLYKSLSDVMDIVLREKSDFKLDSIIHILTNLKDLDLEELALNIGGGIKAQDTYYRFFVKKLKDKMKETGNTNIVLS